MLLFIVGILEASYSGGFSDRFGSVLQIGILIGSMPLLALIVLGGGALGRVGFVHHH